MTSKTKYQLLKVHPNGQDGPVMEAPGKPVDLFSKKKDAVDYALSHPELIGTGSFWAKAVEVMSEEEEQKPEGGEGDQGGED